MPAATVREVRDQLTEIMGTGIGIGDLPMVFYLGESEEGGPTLRANKPKVISKMPYVKSQFTLQQLVNDESATHAVLIIVDG